MNSSTLIRAIIEDNIKLAGSMLPSIENSASLKDSSGTPLLCLVHSVAMAQLLMEAGAAPAQSITPYRRTPLHFAARLGSHELVELFVDSGLDPNATDHQGETALEWAYRFKRDSIARFLSDRGAVRGSISLAVQQHNLSALTAFLERKASAVEDVDERGRTPLHLAAWQGYTDAAGLLIARGSAVNVPDHKGETPLHKAAKGGHEELVKLLCSRGADIEAKDRFGNTPVHCAARAGILHLIGDRAEGLLKGLLNGKNFYHLTPLHFAALNAHLRDVEFLLSQECIVEARTLTGKRALDMAVEEGWSELVKLLGAAGRGYYTRPQNSSKGFGEIDDALLCKALSPYRESTIDELFRKGFVSEIHRAAFRGDTFRLKVILSHDSTAINKKDTLGRTALCYVGSVEAAKLLAEQGADITARDLFMRTPLHYAAARGKEIVDFSISRGASVNAKDCDQWNPLFLAVAHRNHDAVRSLLSHEIRLLYVEDIYGMSPEDWALALKDKGMLEIMKNHRLDMCFEQNYRTEAQHGESEVDFDFFSVI